MSSILGSKKLFIFDRDGVINETPLNSRYVLSKEQLKLRRIVIEIIARLQKCGANVSVASNQQGVGLGLLKINVLHELEKEINTNLISLGGHDLIFFTCTHSKDLNCRCRKPGTLLLEKAMRHYSCSPDETVFIGDQITDFIAAKRALIDFFYVGPFEEEALKYLSSFGEQNSL